VTEAGGRVEYASRPLDLMPLPLQVNFCQ